MSIKALNIFTKSEPITVLQANPREVLKPVESAILRVKTLPDVMDCAINDFLQAGEINPVAKIRFHRILDAALPSIMRPENYLNKGRDSKVFKISDNYVAKIRRGKTEDDAIRVFNVARTPDKRFNQLGIYYGEPVIRVGNVEILKNATPNEYTPCGAIWLDNNSTIEQMRHKYKNEYLPSCSSVPQDGYDELAQGLTQLNGISDKGMFGKRTFYTPDIQNPNNVLIADNHFRIVDDLDKTKISNPNNIFTMLQPLMLRLTPDTSVEMDFNKDVLHNRKNILRKTMIAAEKANLPLEQNELIDPHAEFYLDNVTGNNNYTSMISLVGDMRAKGFSLKDRIGFINNALLEK